MAFTSLSQLFGGADPANVAQKAVNTATGTTNPGKPGDITTAIADADQYAYTVNQQNWYSAKPYGFKWTNRTGNQFVMFLPIAPSNLTISTNFATNFVPTLYGTVEEHSEVRYFDIVIEGTTGMAPKYVQPYPMSSSGISSVEQAASKPLNLPSNARLAFPIASGVSLGGFFSQTVGLLTQAVNQANTLINGAPPVDTGIYTNQTGYLAFHNLYKFLLRYKADVSGEDGGTGPRSGVHPLQFFNYKDGNQYDVVVKNFMLRRSAEDPQMYFYQIVLRGYNLRGTQDNGVANATTAQQLAALGLNGINSSSVLGDIKNLSTQAKSILGSAVGGINVLGR
jgi:hypothetical protein